MASLKQSAIQLVLKAKDALSGKVKQSAESLKYLKGEAGELKDQLNQLKDQKKLLSSFEQQQQATKEAGRSFRQAEAKVASLAREMAKTDKPTKSMQNALNKARREVTASNKAYGQQRQQLASLRGQLNKTGLSSSKLAQQHQKLSHEIEETGYAYDKANKKAKLAERTLKKDTLKKVAKDAGKASSGVRRLSGSFAGLIASAAGLYTIKRGLESILSTGDKFERLDVQLQAIMGSMSEADRALAWIKDFTRNTPFQLEEVSEAFVRLKAFGLDPMDGSMQAIVDQASKLGGGMERLNGISLAVGQAWAKQKLQGEEILQMVERGIPVWELLEKVTGKNVQELQKLSERGKLGREVIADLIKEIGKSSAGAAAKNMSLLSGYVSNLKDSWQNFADEVAKSGALGYAKEQLKDLSDLIGEMSEDGRLTKLAQAISDGFISMAEAVRGSLSTISFDGFVQSITGGFNTISSVLGSLKSVFVRTSNTVKLFFNGFTVAVKTFGATFTNTLGEIIYGWGKLFDLVGADSLAKGFLDTTNKLRAVGKGFVDGIKEDTADINEAFGNLYGEIADKGQQSQESVRREYIKSTDVLKKELEKSSSEAEKTSNTMKSAFTDAADALKQINAAETRTELADLGVVLSQAFADGSITQAKYGELLEASKEKLAELKDQADSTADSVNRVGRAGSEAGSHLSRGAESAKSSLDGLAGFYNNITAELNGLSVQAEVAFKSMQGATRIDTSGTLDDIGQLKQELIETSEEARNLSKSVVVGDVTGIGTWMKDTATNAAYVKTEFLEQKLALEELVEGYNDGSVGARQFASQGQAAVSTMDLLNEQDLDRLNSAIDSATDSMSRLQDQSQSTLDGLQDELDRLLGKQDDIERRQFESRKKELRAQQAEAQSKGDSAAVSHLNQALNLNEQIFNERRRQEQQKKRQERQQAQQESQRQSSPPVTPPQSTPQKIIRLEAPGGGVNIGIAPNDEAKLLTALKNAGLRSV